jgi:hypothetical protein
MAVNVNRAKVRKVLDAACFLCYTAPMEQPERTYKDSVFRTLFGKPEPLRSLLNAISGSRYDEHTPLRINTLDKDVFKSRYNDISVVVDHKLIVLIEHQSTISENLPLRMLFYIAAMYEKEVVSKALYASNLIGLTRPVFYVLYNGDEDFPERKQYRLSDAFEEIPGNADVNLELIVNVINVNKGHNREVLASCQSLGEYALFVDTVREYKQAMRADPHTGDPLAAAVRAAIDYCIAHNILRDFLTEHKSEVFDMMTYEFNLDDAKKVWEEETWAKAQKAFAQKEQMYIQQIRQLGGDPLGQPVRP